MVVITTYQAPGLACLLPTAVAAAILLMIWAARRMCQGPGYGLTAALHVPPPWRGEMVADGTAAARGKRCQRTTNRFVSSHHRHINLGHHPTLYS